MGTTENVSTNGDRSISGDVDFHDFKWWEGYKEDYIWKLLTLFGHIIEELTKDQRKHLNDIVEMNDFLHGIIRGQQYIEECLKQKGESNA